MFLHAGPLLCLTRVTFYARLAPEAGRNPGALSSEHESAETPALDQYTPRTDEIARYLAVGRCVDGVTHDINNYIGAAMAYAELVMLEDGLRDEAKRMLNEVVDRLTHTARMVSDLTTVARRRFSNPSMVLPADVVKATLQLRDYSFKLIRANIFTDLAPDVGAILADGPKVQLALIYLLLNAEEALMEAEVKELCITLRDEDEGVSIYIRDSGPGLSEEAFAAALAPGQTTRTGPNIGLGLTATQAIAQLHGGDLTYTPDTGFRLHLKRENDLKALRFDDA
jgi:two-component system C4-dicarboxylate transport sensor histidine kinase DctB